VTATADTIEVRSNTPITAANAPSVSVHTDQDAIKLEVDVVDSAGKMVKSIDLGPHKAGDFALDATKLSGLAAGSYQLQVKGKTSDGSDIGGSIAISGVVDALQMGDSGGRFRIGPFNVTPASVTQVGATAP